MVGDQEVRWRQMGPGLEAIFSVLTKSNRRLTPHDVEYLKYRLFNGQVPENDPVVTWHLFYKVGHGSPLTQENVKSIGYCRRSWTGSVGIRVTRVTSARSVSGNGCSGLET